MTDPFRYDAQSPLQAIFVRAGITLLVVILFQIGLVIPTPGLTLPPDGLSKLVEGYTLVKIHNHLIAGGGLHIGVGLFALGFLPYLQADALLRFGMLWVPAWKERLEAPISGERLWQHWSLLLSLLFALFDACSFVIWLSAPGGKFFGQLTNYFLPILTLVSGAMLTLWLLRLADRWALAPGVALLSAANVISVYISELIAEFPTLSTTILSSATLLATIALLLLLSWCTIGFYATQGRTPISSARQTTSRRVDKIRNYIPLSLDRARSEAIINAAMVVGSIPLLVKLFPMTVPTAVLQIENPNSISYAILVLIFMALFSLLYTLVNIDAYELADRLKKQGSFIPGIRPGMETARFLQKRILRLTTIGIIYKSLLFLAIWNLFRLGWLREDPILLISTFIVLINLGETILRRIQAQIALGSYEGLLDREGHRKRWWRWLLD